MASRSVRFVMTPAPTAITADSSLADAARVMRDENIGDVLVLKNDQLFGILTDRDITVRGIAEGYRADNTPVEQVCSKHVVTVSVTDTEDDAIRLMRSAAVRRLPVLENGVPVGIVSLGDLAQETDPDSALGIISGARPNT